MSSWSMNSTRCLLPESSLDGVVPTTLPEIDLLGFELVKSGAEESACEGFISWHVLRRIGTKLFEERGPPRFFFS